MSDTIEIPRGHWAEPIVKAWVDRGTTEYCPYMSRGKTVDGNEMRYLSLRFRLDDGKFHMVEVLITEPISAEKPDGINVLDTPNGAGPV